MKTFGKIIDDFGGVAAVAKILKIDESHVRVMKARDSIPPQYWGALIDKAVAHGIAGLDYQKFHRLRDARFQPGASTPKAG